MTDEDFYNYYAESVKFLRYPEYWDTYWLFPEEESFLERQKALNALYRFYHSGIMKFEDFDKNNAMEAFKLLENAPWAAVDLNKYHDAWMVLRVRGTDFFIETEASRLGIPLDSDEPFSPDYRKNLTAYFQKHGVGFEKGNVYPPK
ncbi:hypothetical protein FAI40_04325 [Acetobacteraceae bacterium]|nr:hypothetical protein FAI40_04325 [Acetobacteraceae bacterium]